MPNTTTTPNMNLAVPVVGTQTGPQYATDINNCFTVIDQHDHSLGKGVQISSDSINITADLALNDYNLTSVRSLRCQSQPAVLALSSDLDCFYVVGVDAYYNDGNGNQIRITQSGGIAGSPGSISGLTSPAAASYVAANQTFVWQSASNTAANLDAGSVIIREVAASAKGITLSSPLSLASDYTLTLPSSLPGAQKFMTLNSSGVISAPWAVDNSTIEIASSTTVQVKDLGITAAKIANATITTTQISNSAGITGTQIAATTIAAANIVNATITGTQVASNINLSGDTVQQNSKNLIASQTNATKGLVVIRAGFNSAATRTKGEGATASIVVTGIYSVVFTTAFGDTPSISASVDATLAGTNLFATYRNCSSSGVDIIIQTPAGVLTNIAFDIIAIGQRA